MKELKQVNRINSNGQERAKLLGARVLRARKLKFKKAMYLGIADILNVGSILNESSRISDKFRSRLRDTGVLYHSENVAVVLNRDAQKVGNDFGKVLQKLDVVPVSHPLVWIYVAKDTGEQEPEVDNNGFTSEYAR